MLAKLFNDISVGSLVRAIGMATVLCVVAQFLKVIPAPQLRVAHWHIEVAPWLFNTSVIVFVVSCSVAISFGLNRLEILRKDYHLIPVLTIGLLPPMLSSGDLGLVLLLPLGVALIMRTLSLAAGKRYGFVLFDVGCLIAIMMLLRPEALIFLLIGWLGVLSFGRLFFRALLMPLVGLVAIWFMLFSISFGLGDAGMVEQVALSFTEVPLNLAVGKGPMFEGWGHLAPLLVVLLPALLHLPRVFNRANVLKRQVYTFLNFKALVLLVAGSLVENYLALWIWLVIPLAVFLVNFIQDQQKKWRKDVIYLLLLLYLGLSLFF